MATGMADVLQQKRREYAQHREDYLRQLQLKKEKATLLFRHVIKLFTALREAGLQIPFEDDGESVMIALPLIHPEAIATLIKYAPRGAVRIWIAMDEHLSQELFTQALLQDEETEPYLAIHVDFGLTDEYPIHDGVYLFSDLTKKEAINFLLDLLVTIEGVGREEIQS